MRRTSAKEVESVLKLDGPARFDHFVKRVVDAECAWGLWRDGWALMADDSGVALFPLWPAREYAELHRTGEWADFEASEIPLEDLLGQLLPSFEEKGMRPGVFPTPGGKSVAPEAAELAASLRRELEKY